MRLERLETLLWERIDGVINAQDEAELEAFLAEDSDARELDQELTALAGRLASVRDVAPPQVLRGRIDEALAAAGLPDADKGPPALAVRRRSSEGWGPRILAVAASLLVGVGIGHLLHVGGGQPVDEFKAAGTLYAPAAPAASVSQTIDFGEGVGRLETRRAEGRLWVELALAEEHVVELHLDAEEGALLMTGVREDAGGAGEAQADGGRVFVRKDGPGSIGIELLSSGPAAPVRLSISLDGVPIAERWIEPGDGGQP